MQAPRVGDQRDGKNFNVNVANLTPIENKLNFGIKIVSKIKLE
jgi:hypothetical protein